MDNNQSLLANDMMIDSVSFNHLKETAMWAKIMAVIGLILGVVIIIAAILAGAYLGQVNNRYNGGVAVPGLGGMVGVVYGLIGVVYFFCSLFHLRFAVKMKEALLNNDQHTLNLSFQNLKVYYRITGILTIIGAAFFALGILGLLINLSSRGY
jgi:hypothetical protein